MRREVTVCGRCVDEAGTPLAGCTVKLQAVPVSYTHLTLPTILRV